MWRCPLNGRPSGCAVASFSLLPSVPSSFDLQSQLSPSSSLHVALEIPALDVSLVDGRPQELLLLSMDGLVAEYHAGNSAGVAYTQASTQLGYHLDTMQQLRQGRGYDKAGALKSVQTMCSGLLVVCHGGWQCGRHASAAEAVTPCTTVGSTA